MTTKRSRTGVSQGTERAVSPGNLDPGRSRLVGGGARKGDTNCVQSQETQKKR